MPTAVKEKKNDILRASFHIYLQVDDNRSLEKLPLTFGLPYTARIFDMSSSNQPVSFSFLICVRQCK